MASGTLRIYLGAAPGVGKTFAMLNEGWRRRERGTDVVAAYVEPHDRPRTAEQLRDLPVIARRMVTYRGLPVEEMDLDAVLARHPAVALVDELAHTNVPGSRHTKRWQDVGELLDAGISVISTLNIQHLESLNDVVESITGVTQRETVPDHVVRAADQIELVDMSPESLRRRLAHGNIYGPDRVDAALGNYFRPGNLAALRELALLWVADLVDEGLQKYRERHGIADPWETKERVVVALTGSPKGERMIRRGARMAARARAELVGVHIRPADGLAGPSTERLQGHRALLAELDGRYAEITGNDPAAALVNFARAENATQLLMGATGRSRWRELTHGSIINEVIRQAGGIDVHVISNRAEDDEQARLPHLPRRRHLATLGARRRIWGWVLALAGMPALALALVPFRASLAPVGSVPELLSGVVVVAVVGGLYPAVVGSVVAFAFADWFLIPPLHSFTFRRPGDAVALVTFVVVGVVVSGLIDRLSRRALQVERARVEAEALARLAGGSVLSGQETLPTLVAELRATFAVDAVAVLAPSGAGGAADWTVQAAAGSPVPGHPAEGQFSAELAAGSVLVIAGPGLAADDRRLLGAFIAQLRVAQERDRLHDTAAAVASLSESNELRTALLTALSHDLRAPLASIKATATSLLSDEVRWDAETAHSFYVTIDAEADRLNNLVGNLLDMSRLQTGALKLAMRPVAVDEVVFAALASMSGDSSSVVVDVPEDLGLIQADPALLERCVANLISNAIAWSPPGRPVRITAAIAAPDQLDPVRRDQQAEPCGAPRPAQVELRVIDRGPGIPLHYRDAVTEPFERFGDAGRANGDGVGLGLAVARGFIDAMGGELALDDTPGGGLTAVMRLAVTDPAPGRAHYPEPHYQGPRKTGRRALTAGEKTPE